MMESIKQLFAADLSDYFPGLSFPINVFLFATALGICLGCVAAHICSSALFSLIRQMLRAEAVGEEGAKTLAELREDRFWTRRILSQRSGRTAAYIRKAGEVSPTYEEYLAEEKEKREQFRAARKRKDKAAVFALTSAKSAKEDFSLARWYIPESARAEAARYYERHENSVFKTILVCLLTLAFFAALMIFTPRILALIRDLFA